MEDVGCQLHRQQQYIYLPGKEMSGDKKRVHSKVIQQRGKRQHPLYPGTEKIFYFISPFGQKYLTEYISSTTH